MASQLPLILSEVEGRTMVAPRQSLSHEERRDA
jgi:hypothetical protein